jgi:hypothetical protein
MRCKRNRMLAPIERGFLFIRRHTRSRFVAMDDRQRQHNKRQVLRNRQRQHMRVLKIVTDMPPPAGLRVLSGDMAVELASTRAFARWTRIDWQAIPVECEATCSFNAGTKDIKRQDTASLQKGLMPSGLSKKERVKWFERHSQSSSHASGTGATARDAQCAGDSNGLPELDCTELAALDSATAAAADQVLSERVAQREARAAQRTLRKRLQVESFAVVLNAIIEVTRTPVFKSFTVRFISTGARGTGPEPDTHCGGFR